MQTQDRAKIMYRYKYRELVLIFLTVETNNTTELTATIIRIPYIISSES